MTMQETVDMPRWQCQRCGYCWVGRVLGRPKRCPRCKNAYWYRPYERPSVSQKLRAIWAQRAAEAAEASCDAC